MLASKIFCKGGNEGGRKEEGREGGKQERISNQPS